MKKIEYDIPVFEDEDIADLKEYSEKMAVALKEQVDKFGNPIIYKDVVANKEELEALTDIKNGYIYRVRSEQKNYIFNGSEWKEYSDNMTTIYDTNNNGIVDNAEKVNGHTVNSDVPENAVFTDTKYVLPTASSTLGGVKTTSTVTSNNGYIACPIISGVPYYKDTNTTYSNATTSSAGLMSSGDKTKLDGIATGANKTTINNTLTSTSTSEALSANQGKVLNDKYNGTVLYNNTTGTNGTVTLSASAADFSYLEIFYRNDNNRYKSVKIYEANGKAVSLLSSSLDSNSASNLKYKDITINSKTITNVYTQTLQFWSGAWHNTDANNVIYIVRVVGYK